MSIIEPASSRSTQLDHVRRIRALERSGSIWICVGTVGVDGVDDLLSSESPPFLNGWTNSLGDDFPVAYTMMHGWVLIRGGFVGGGDGTEIFELPAGYRPGSLQPLVIPTSAVDHFATVRVYPTGAVVFGTVV